MAWIDDRIWCHPKFADLSPAAFSSYVKGIAYASGFGTKGVLTRGQQQQVSAAGRVRKELISAGLWDEAEHLEKNAIVIHDWEEHNGKRDARREADRERKKAYRSQKRPQDSPQDSPQDGSAEPPQERRTPVRTNVRTLSATAAHVDGSEGSDGSRTDQEQDQNPATAIASLNAGRANGHDLAPIATHLTAALPVCVQAGTTSNELAESDPGDIPWA